MWPAFSIKLCVLRKYASAYITCKYYRLAAIMIKSANVLTQTDLITSLHGYYVCKHILHTRYTTNDLGRFQYKNYMHNTYFVIYSYRHICLRSMITYYNNDADNHMSLKTNIKTLFYTHNFNQILMFQKITHLMMICPVLCDALLNICAMLAFTEAGGISNSWGSPVVVVLIVVVSVIGSVAAKDVDGSTVVVISLTSVMATVVSVVLLVPTGSAASFSIATVMGSVLIVGKCMSFVSLALFRVSFCRASVCTDRIWIPMISTIASPNIFRLCAIFGQFDKVFIGASFNGDIIAVYDVRNVEQTN